MTAKGMESFSTNMFKVVDNQIDLYYSQFININKVTLEIIDFYLHNNMDVQFLVEDVEKIAKKKKQAAPIIKSKEDTNKFIKR